MSENDFSYFKNICFSRRSVRAFKQQAVDQSLIQQVLSCAQQTPSSCNTQPWKVHVVSGEKKRQLAKKFVESINNGEYKPDFEHSMKYEGVYRERQHAAAALLYGAMGIARDDKAARHQAFLRNYHFFDAPHVAFIGMDEGFGLREVVDIGMYTQTLLLGLTAHGLASCPQNALSFNGDLVRRELNLPQQWRVLLGVSFGYEDLSADANAVRTEREAIDKSVQFHR